MPEICRFFGMIIAMYYNDHAPPHFHVHYGGQKATIDIQALSVLDGTLPPRALGLIIEWASLHQAELMSNWQRAQKLEPLVKISPLE